MVRKSPSRLVVEHGIDKPILSDDVGHMSGRSSSEWTPRGGIASAKKINDLALRLTKSAEEWALSDWRRDDTGIRTAPLMACRNKLALPSILL